MCFCFSVAITFSFVADKNYRVAADDLKSETGENRGEQNYNGADLDGKINDIIFSMSEEDFQFVIDELNLICGENRSLKETIIAFITGESGLGYDSVKSYMLSRAFSLLSENYDSLIYLACLIALLAASNIIISKNSDSIEKSVIFYIYYPLIVCLVLSLVKSAIDYTENVVKSETELTELFFPVMFSVTAVAGNFGATMIKPFTVFLVYFTSELILGFFIPLLYFAFAVLSVGNLFGKADFNELFKTVLSVFKWSAGLIAGVYSALLTVEGLTNAAYNGVSVKILKYLSGTSVPIVGGLIGGSTDIILSAVTLVKNSLGVMSAVIIIFFVGLKGVNSIVYSSSLKLLNSLLAPISAPRVTKLINGSCEIISALAALIFLSGLMFLLTVVFVIKSTSGVI